MPTPHPVSGYDHWALRLHALSEGDRSSKTGAYDDSIRLDSPDRQWMAALLSQLYRQLGPGDKLVDVTYDKWSREWNRVRAFLGLLAAGLHMLRHVGPSDDIHARRRTGDEAFKRGQ